MLRIDSFQKRLYRMNTFYILNRWDEESSN